MITVAKVYQRIKSHLYSMLFKCFCRAGLYGRFNVLGPAVMHGLPFIKNHGKISIGSGFRCNSGKNYNPIGGDTICRIVVYEKGTLSIANDVGISNSTIVCMNSIIIEDKVLVGGSCRIWDTDFHSQDALIRTSARDNDVKTAPILIRKNVFIGGGSTVLKGVEIGENSIVAAGSVVTKNIPPNEIWGGNPAKLIRIIPIK